MPKTADRKRRTLAGGGVEAFRGDMLLVSSMESTGSLTGPSMRKVFTFAKVVSVGRDGWATAHINPGMTGIFKGRVDAPLIRKDLLRGFSADEVLERLPREYPGLHPWMRDYTTVELAKADLLRVLDEMERERAQ